MIMRNRFELWIIDNDVIYVVRVQRYDDESSDLMPFHEESSHRFVAEEVD